MKRPSKRQQQQIIDWAKQSFALSYPLFELRGAFDLSRMSQEQVDAFAAAAAEVGGTQMSLEQANALAARFAANRYQAQIPTYEHISNRLRGKPGSREFQNGLAALYGSQAVNHAYAAWCEGGAHDVIRERAGIGAEAVGALIRHFAQIRPDLMVCTRCNRKRTSGRSFVAQPPGTRLLCAPCDELVNRRHREHALKLDEIAALYDQGMSNHRIAELTGHSRRFIHGALTSRPVRKACPVCYRVRRRGVSFGGFPYRDQAGAVRTLATCSRCIREMNEKGVTMLADPDAQSSAPKGESNVHS